MCDDEPWQLFTDTDNSLANSFLESTKLLLPKETFSKLERINIGHVLENVSTYQQNKIETVIILLYNSIKNEIEDISKSGGIKLQAFIEHTSFSRDDQNEICYNLKFLLEEDGFDVSPSPNFKSTVSLDINWERPFKYMIGSDKYKKGKEEFKSI